jgi:hypothetical protein
MAFPLGGGHLLSALSKALLPPAEMLVIERKRGPACAAGSGEMEQPDRPSEGGVRLPRLRGCSTDSLTPGRRALRKSARDCTVADRGDQCLCGARFGDPDAGRGRQLTRSPAAGV